MNLKSMKTLSISGIIISLFFLIFFGYIYLNMELNTLLFVLTIIYPNLLGFFISSQFFIKIPQTKWLKYIYWIGVFTFIVMILYPLLFFTILLKRNFGFEFYLAVFVIFSPSNILFLTNTILLLKKHIKNQTASEINVCS